MWLVSSLYMLYMRHLHWLDFDEAGRKDRQASFDSDLPTADVIICYPMGRLRRDLAKHCQNRMYNMYMYTVHSHPA